MAKPVPTEVEVLSMRVSHQGFFKLTVRELRHRKFDGGWTPVLNRELFERGHAVAVLPYDPVADTVVMIRHFLPGAYVAGKEAWPLSIVAGMIEPRESLEGVARREAEEEAGLEIGELIKIAGYMPSPGGSTETIMIFCGLVDSRGAGGVHGVAEENEDIRVEVIPALEAIALLDAGLILPSVALISLHWLARHRENLRRGV